MRQFSSHCVTYHAYRLQARAFYAAVLFGLSFIGLAITDRPPQAMVVAILGALAIGISIGAWMVARRFKD